MVDSGAQEPQLWEDGFRSMIKHYKGIREYLRIRQRPRRDPPQVLVFIGPTGTGKSHTAYQLAPDLYSVPQAKGSGTYWDGYFAQDTVLIDEMYGSRFSHGFLLQLLDRYAMSVPIHCGSVNFSSKRIILCSNAHPEEWYPKIYAERGALFTEGPLFRRMTTNNSGIFRIDQKGSPPVLLHGDYKGPLTEITLEEEDEVPPLIRQDAVFVGAERNRQIITDLQTEYGQAIRNNFVDIH
jgi:DNA polymerase III delta prime subunit